MLYIQHDKDLRYVHRYADAKRSVEVSFAASVYA